MGKPLQVALPREQYVDAGTWSAEREAVLYGEWYCVGRRDDLGLDTPGRLAVVDVVGESVLVTSDETGRLHAAYNVCRHRGSQVVPVVDPGETVTCAASALRCPYHSWTYGLDGRLLKAPHADLDDPEAFALTDVGADTWGGFVFVHLTPDGATPLAEAVARTARTLAELRARGPRHRQDAPLRRGRELQGAAGELQRVLPLRPGAPRAQPAGARRSRAAVPGSTGTRGSRTARARGPSR